MKITEAIKTVFKQEKIIKTFILLATFTLISYYIFLYLPAFMPENVFSKPHLSALLLFTICTDLYLSGCYLTITKNIISSNKFGNWFSRNSNIFLLGAKFQTGLISYGVMLGLVSILVGVFVRVCLVGSCNVIVGYITIITLAVACIFGTRFTSYAITLGLIKFIVDTHPHLQIGMYPNIINSASIMSSILLLILTFTIVIIYPSIIINFLQKKTVSSIYQCQNILQIIKANTKKYCSLIRKLLLVSFLGCFIIITYACIVSAISKNLNPIVIQIFVSIMFVLISLVSNVLIADYARETDNNAV